MNEQYPAFHRRIDPAIEPPFGLAGLGVSPATLEISGNGSVETIERRMMQVLIALHRRCGEAVSRDELSLLCWDGRIVGDDALNRIISRLRKALDREPAVAIDTIPKVGYRLRVERADAPPEPRTTRRRPKLVPVAAAVAMLLVLIAAVAFVYRPAARFDVETMRPLTREDGVEIFPALSPDGKQLAYAAGAGFGAATDLFLRGTVLGETRPIRLTATPESEISPAWSRDGVRLAFVRVRPDRPCEIVLVTPPDRTERVVGRCRDARHTRIDWLDERSIVFSDGPVDGPWRLFAMDVNSGQARPLTAPGTRAFGDTAPAVSPDGRRVAFRRTVAPGNDDILLLETASGDVRPLGVGGWKGIGIAWGADSRTLFMTSNRGGDFGLWAVDTQRSDAPRRVSQGILNLGQMSADRNGNLAIETIRTRANLFAFAATADPVPLTGAASNDWDPDIAADGRIVFGSDLSGSNQLWLLRPGEEPVRLTRLGGSYVYSPRWSPDGRRIAFIAVDQGRRDLYTMNADGAELRRLTDDGRNKGTAVWAGPSELLYTEETERGWRLMRLSPGRAPRPVPGGDGLTVLRRAPDGGLFGLSATMAVRRLQDRGGGVTTAPTGVTAAIAEAWAPGRDGIYWLDGGPAGPWTIRFTGWTGQSRPVGRLQSLARPALALRPSDGAIVAPRLVEEAADLLLFGLRGD